jgi:hypothetical protein
MLVEEAAIAAVPVEAEVLVVRRYIHPSAHAILRSTRFKSCGCQKRINDIDLRHKNENDKINCPMTSVINGQSRDGYFRQIAE